mmetsp:Transcript_64945/g.120895  ORF Transcript_64945/g.120895 Transcript_64945/m.120895 type:complete len:503 (+) Transcript_64945:142-1650(+)
MISLSYVLVLHGLCALAVTEVAERKTNGALEQVQQTVHEAGDVCEHEASIPYDPTPSRKLTGEPHFRSLLQHPEQIRTAVAALAGETPYAAWRRISPQVANASLSQKGAPSSQPGLFPLAVGSWNLSSAASTVPDSLGRLERSPIATLALSEQEKEQLNTDAMATTFVASIAKQIFDSFISAFMFPVGGAIVVFGLIVICGFFMMDRGAGEKAEGNEQDYKDSKSTGRESLASRLHVDTNVAGMRGSYPGVTPRQHGGSAWPQSSPDLGYAAEPVMAGRYSETMQPRSSLKGSNSNPPRVAGVPVRFSELGTPRKEGGEASNALLCRGLLVPPGTECVLAVPTLDQVGVPPAQSGTLLIRDMAGLPIVAMDIRRPGDDLQQPICILKTATTTMTEILAYCMARGDNSIAISTGAHEPFATMGKLGHTYTLTSAGARLVFDGDIASHKFKVMNSRRCMADTQPAKVKFDSGEYYQLRAAAHSDCGLLLCALVCIDLMELARLR